MVVALVELGRVTLCDRVVLVLVAGLAELLAGKLLDLVTELLVFVLGFVVLVTEELGL